MSQNYPQINRDLLLTGAFFHDIGKIHELAYNRSFSYTTRGQLLGHMIIELEMLQAKLAFQPGLPDELKTDDRAPHHQPPRPIRLLLAQTAYGFLEALMLHYLDDLDSKMEAMRATFEREAAGLDISLDQRITHPLGRPLLNTEKFLAPKKVKPPEDPAIAAAEAELAAEESPEQTPTLLDIEPRR